MLLLLLLGPAFVDLLRVDRSGNERSDVSCTTEVRLLR